MDSGILAGFVDLQPLAQDEDLASALKAAQIAYAAFSEALEAGDVNMRASEKALEAFGDLEEELEKYGDGALFLVTFSPDGNGHTSQYEVSLTIKGFRLRVTYPDSSRAYLYEPGDISEVIALQTGHIA